VQTAQSKFGKFGQPSSRIDNAELHVWLSSQEMQEFDLPTISQIRGAEKRKLPNLENLPWTLQAENPA
jgi:hypothetical protein